MLRSVFRPKETVAQTLPSHKTESLDFSSSRNRDLRYWPLRTRWLGRSLSACPASVGTPSTEPAGHFCRRQQKPVFESFQNYSTAPSSPSTDVSLDRAHRHIPRAAGRG